MTEDRSPSGGGVAMGILLYLVLYVASWLLALNAYDSPEAGIVLAGVTALVGLGLAIAGRSRTARGIGVGMLIGLAIALVLTAACFAVVASMLDH